MNYGAHSKLVEEVIQFSRTLQCASPSLHLLNEIDVINEIERAEFLAYEEVFGEDEYTWKDIRELEMSEVWGGYYNLSEDGKTLELDGLLDIIAGNVRKSENVLSDFFDDVVADLKNCAVNRAINGKTNNFFDKIFEIYKASGFPCGWSGDYPDPEGRIIAYFALEK